MYPSCVVPPFVSKEQANEHRDREIGGDKQRVIPVSMEEHFQFSKQDNQ
jgi:hypothetical protein